MIQASTHGGFPPGPRGEVSRGDGGDGEAFLERARQELREVFGFHSFREGQERAIRAIGCGRDLLVIMPTGSGKSLCYQVPALALPGVTLVVSPLIALMKDQTDALTLRGVAATFINSSLSLEEERERMEGLRRQLYRIVYVAPERFRKASFRAALAGVRISLVAVDEAHCISEWGHDFRPDYRRLKEIRSQLGPVPAVALTATATPEVQADIARELEMRDPEKVVTGFRRPNLELMVRKANGKGGKRERLEEFLREVLGRSRGTGIPAGIVYAGTRKHAEEVARDLNAASWPSCPPPPGRPAIARAYHAGLNSEERRQVQEDFMEGRLPWVVATNAFGMGVDKSDIRFVAHYDLPGSIESYYQEVGRGGRDGKPADCLLIFSESDRRLQEFFIEGSNPDRATIEAAYGFLGGLGENPIFRTVTDLEALFRGRGGSAPANPLAFGSSLVVLERAGVIERLDHGQNLAEVSPRTIAATEAAPARPSQKELVRRALANVFRENGGEPASISLERWSAELPLPLETLRRSLSQLDEEGAIDYLPPFRGRAIRLPARRPDLAGCVDFAALDRRRRRDLERLEEVLRFARSRSCRQHAILRHFGEPASEGGCGHCDSCRVAAPGATAPLREVGERERTMVLKILSGVARAHGRCGKKRLIQMLRGSRSSAVSRLGLDRLSTHGILRDLDGEALEEVVDSLEGAGCLCQSEGPYPVLRLTPLGLRVMKGEEGVAAGMLGSLLRAPRPVPAERPSPAAAPPKGGEDESEVDRSLFEKLRKLRREIAAELGVPAYRVFNDRTLKAMTRELPQDREALLEIPGVGRVTLERFGDRFLAALRER
jgi:ATP-dependent DNA helicase RecQ